MKQHQARYPVLMDKQGTTALCRVDSLSRISTVPIYDFHNLLTRKKCSA